MKSASEEIGRPIEDARKAHSRVEYTNNPSSFKKQEEGKHMERVW